ncbi:polyphosphate kinase 1 [Porticoccus sp.]
MKKYPYFPKELSWLAFNERVIQEAQDADNPVIDRVHFLGIFSNNQDEFFKVRVADVRRKVLIEQVAGTAKESKQLLRDINKGIARLSEQFDVAFQSILKELKKRRIHFLIPADLSTKQGEWVRRHFREQVLPRIVPILVTPQIDLSRVLQDGANYLVVEIRKGEQVNFALLEVPDTSSRFLRLPNDEKNRHRYFMIIDEAIRYCLDLVLADFFDYDQLDAWSMKFSRDAEYVLDDDIDRSLVEKMSIGLKQRLQANPVRLTFDREMPAEMLDMLKSKFGFTKGDSIIPGGRYRNFRDFIGFANPGEKYLANQPLPPLSIRKFDRASNAFRALDQGDILLYYPYHKFNYFVELLRQAAFDPKVTSIKINIYRVAKDSRVLESLMDAARNGKQVTVNVELKARFDEKQNLDLSEKLSEAGIKVMLGIPGLKVHSKLCLINRISADGEKLYAHIGTGNFNEKTAEIYTDFSLFTSHPEICNEVRNVFNFIENSFKHYDFKYLQVSPLNNRAKIRSLINREITAARAGKPAAMTLKLNNLVDESIVKLLYQASQAGVKIRMIVRGMCSLQPGLEGLSENISIISIVDRFLEHPRCLVFHNGGNPEVYISSADWMTRNLDYRLEVGVPILDPKLKKQVIDILEIQFTDRCKARVIDAEQSNVYVKRGNKKKIRSQIAIYHYLKKFE